MDHCFVQLLAKFPVRHQSGRRHARGIKHGIFVKTSLKSRLSITMNSRCNIGATRRGRGALANAPDLGERTRPGACWAAKSGRRSRLGTTPLCPYIAPRALKAHGATA